MAITSGSYTIGSGGDYANLVNFCDDISASSVNGDITGIFISDITDLVNYTKTIYMNGYTLTITSNTYHNGYVPSSYKLYMYNISLTIQSSNSKLVIYNLSIRCNALYINGYSTAANTTATIKYCVITINTNYLYFRRCTTYIYRNTFNITGNIGPYGSSIDIDLNNTIYFENNTFDLKGVVLIRSANNNNATFRNNVFNITGIGTTTFWVGFSVILYGYNNTSNKSDMVNSLFVSGGSGNVPSVNYTPEFNSTSISNSGFYKVNQSSVYVVNGGTTPQISGNILGIRLNFTPHNGYYSIGSDDYFPPINPSKIRFTYKTNYADLYLPILPYNITIDYPWDFLKMPNESVNIVDHGYGGQSYDKRSCTCRFIMTPTEADEFNNDILIPYDQDSTDGLTIEMGVLSMFHPFGPDFSNVGPYTVMMRVIKAPYLSEEYYGNFEMELELFLTALPPSYSFVTDQNEGNMSIGSVSGLRFPRTMYRNNRLISNRFTQLQGQYSTERINLYYKTYESEINLTCNLPKAQRLINYITTNRTSTYSIGDSSGYLFGEELGTGTHSNCYLVTNKINIDFRGLYDINFNLKFVKTV